MLRYRLDDLGCYQFEKLCQSALKAVAGLSVESWGNRSDIGRDAYAPGPLRFPDPNVDGAGPFVFQVKFVESANAAGAKPAPPLRSSLSKELLAIKERIRKKQWSNPSCYVVLTNALVDGKTREGIRASIHGVLPKAQVVVWGGDDVCDVLDQKPKVARAFPQLLSIRDLDVLISGALKKKSRERSSAAIQLAEELVPVFAPTVSYERTWSVLQKHHFVVLEGPPEVGKSAIAWMVGLTQVASGWEAIVCRSPDTFFEMYESSANQVFIADDAFGRTEYDPARTSKWEADLHYILHRLDKQHWLVWTSRKHILERACQRMDAQGKARSFPDPGAVLVDVQALSIEEKSLILFRHAKAAGLEPEAKALVRKNAGIIVSDAEFTPERMRRFVRESLPGLVGKIQSRTVKSDQIAMAVKELLRNPSKQMKVAFNSLPAAYKWFLVALLEISEVEPLPWRFRMFGNLEHLRELYDAYCPDSKREPFETVADHLTEAFVKVRKNDWGKLAVDWIHPSYRDLVIDELIEDAELRNAFLKRASLEGIKLAVSDTGGLSGRRRLPFIRSAEAWDVLRERCLDLSSRGEQQRELLETVANAAGRDSGADNANRWPKLISDVCAEVKKFWDDNKIVLSAKDIRAYALANAQALPTVAPPNLDSTWESLEESFRQSIRNAETGRALDYDAFYDLTAFAEAVPYVDASYLMERRFPQAYEAEIATVIEEAESEAEAEMIDSDPESLRNRAEEMESLAVAMERLSGISSSHSHALGVAVQLRSGAEDLEREAEENEPPEPDDADEYRASPRSDIFDISGLFAEL